MEGFRGLASLIDACDEVISIDNSIVHFAGQSAKSVIFYYRLDQIGAGDQRTKKVLIGIQA